MNSYVYLSLRTYVLSQSRIGKVLDKNEEEGLNLTSWTCNSYPVPRTSAADTAIQIYYERENTKSQLFPTTSTVDTVPRTGYCRDNTADKLPTGTHKQARTD